MLHRKAFLKILTLVVVIAIVGLLNLYSATHGLGAKSVLFTKQVCWTIIGLLSFIGVYFFIDYRKIDGYACYIYGLVFFLLVCVLFISPKIMGARRWLNLGPFTLQPSEISKLVLVIVLASFFSKTEKDEVNVKEFLQAGFITLGLFLPIVLEPDLGTGLIIAILFFSLCILTRIQPRILIICLLIAISFSPLVWQYGLKPYQKARIIGFICPQRDPFGIGYHVLQSKIAVGSGRWWGKGFLKGTQTKLCFLPEHYTDFIFSVFAEEWGFIGCLGLLMLYLGLLLTGVWICQKAKDRFGYLLAAGITAMFFWQTIINIAMALGLLPVVGIPLPFMSYGGSAVLTNFTALGILANIGDNRLMK